MEIISKELFSEVLGEEIKNFDVLDTKILYRKPTMLSGFINIYELAHKCKEWAYKQGFDISSGYSFGINCPSLNYAQINTKEKKIELFLSKTETEAILKACQWILEQKAKA